MVGSPIRMPLWGTVRSGPPLREHYKFQNPLCKTPVGLSFFLRLDRSAEAKWRGHPLSFRLRPPGAPLNNMMRTPDRSLRSSEFRACRASALVESGWAASAAGSGLMVDSIAVELWPFFCLSQPACVVRAVLRAAFPCTRHGGAAFPSCRPCEDPVHRWPQKRAKRNVAFAVEGDVYAYTRLVSNSAPTW